MAVDSPDGQKLFILFPVVFDKEDVHFFRSHHAGGT